MKKPPGDIIILHMCTVNINHIMYGSWDMERDRHNFSSFWTIFLHFHPPNNTENQNFEKKRKKHQQILSFYDSIPKIMIIRYTVPEIWHVTDVIFIFHFGLFFALSATYQPKKTKFLNNEKKKQLEISPFYPCVSKTMINWCMVPEIMVSDRWTDGQKAGKSNIYRWVPHRKITCFKHFTKQTRL